ncbi:hypothetical protein, partial [Oenococcus oeni]
DKSKSFLLSTIKEKYMTLKYVESWKIFFLHNDNLHNTIAALENDIEITSDRREYELARELLDLLSDFNIPSDELLLRFKFSFFKNLFFKKQAEAVKLNNQLIETLRLMNSNQLASAYDEYMSTFYQNKLS